MLELRGIAKRFGAFAVEDLDLRVPTGSYFVLLGPSGVGKTVLLELVAGLIRPDAGQVLWDGCDITSAAPERRGFAMVYQDYALFGHLTVAGNISYGLRSRGMSRGEASRRSAEIAEQLGVASLLNRRPTTLSGGEAQRVALARAMVTAPKLLLLDEPLAAVDVGVRHRLRAELQRLHERTHTTFLHVTHDVEEAMTLADEVGVMLQGRIRQVAPPAQLFRRPSDADVADFLGLRNVLAVRCEQPGLCRAGAATIHVAGAHPGTRYAWIRPEEILLSRGAFDSSARNQFRARVTEWRHTGTLLSVTVRCEPTGPAGLEDAGTLPAQEPLELTALVTYASFEQLGLAAGTEVFVTLKSSAVHCF